MELEKVDDRVSAKEKQNPKEPVVAQAPPTLEPLIHNFDIDNKGSLHLEKNFVRRNRIERLLQTHGNQSSCSIELFNKNASIRSSLFRQSLTFH